MQTIVKVKKKKKNEVKASIQKPEDGNITMMTIDRHQMQDWDKCIDETFLGVFRNDQHDQIMK